jgi:uncharacterized protein (DUF3820 family)
MTDKREEMKEQSKQLFRESCEFKLPFGKHKGKTLREIGRNDDGLLYLDWLRSIDLYPETRTHVHRYLNHPSVDRLVSAAVDKGRRKP